MTKGHGINVMCLPCAAFLVDANGVVTHWNSPMDEIANGVPVEEWVVRFGKADGPVPFSKWVHYGEDGRVQTTLYILEQPRREHQKPAGITLGPEILRNWSSGLLFVDEELVLQYANVTAMHNLGIDESAIGRPIEAIFPLKPNQYDPFVTLILERSIRRNHVVTWERNGRVKHMLVDSCPMEPAQGTSSGILWCIRDIGNVSSLEQQMQRSDNLATLGKVAAGVAHEIRNPLTSIKGFLQILKHEFENSALKKEYKYTEVMLTEIERVNGLVSELLLLSKPRAIRIVPVELGELIHSIAPIIRSEALLYNIEFHLCLQSVPPVLGDREMLKQVFLNLSKNAIEAMENGGRLKVSTEYSAEERMVRIDFQDTGPGIPSYLLDRIFDAFFTTKEKGTGLGLAICQRIIHDLGGTIRVASKGYGTTFSVMLPEFLPEKGTMVG
jgi:two-component system, sporulation sensor kinase E